MKDLGEKIERFWSETTDTHAMSPSEIVNKTANIFGGYNPYGSPPPPPPEDPKPVEPEYQLLNPDEAFHALMKVEHCQSVQNRVAALERLGIRLVKVK
jgi:hypothetical protein